MVRINNIFRNTKCTINCDCSIMANALDCGSSEASSILVSHPIIIKYNYNAYERIDNMLNGLRRLTGGTDYINYLQKSLSRTGNAKVIKELKSAKPIGEDRARISATLILTAHGNRLTNDLFGLLADGFSLDSIKIAIV